MDPITINVHVQIGVTDTLCGLLSAFIKKDVPAVAAPGAPAESKPAPEAPAAEVINNEAPAKTAEPAADPAREEAPAEEAQAAEEAKEYTEVDVRAAMDRTRKRIEGEDYKENTASEAYKKYHRALTSQFKNIAAVLGCDKPSLLPTSELRASFIAQCDELYVDEAGKIQTKCPF